MYKTDVVHFLIKRKNDLCQIWRIATWSQSNWYLCNPDDDTNMKANLSSS